MKPSCVICGRRPVERHHPTGRAGHDLPYFDSGFVVPLCKLCHDREHVALRRRGLEWPTTGSLRHRLHRVADHLGRLADVERGIVLDPAATRALAELLVEAASLVAVGEAVVR